MTDRAMTAGEAQWCIDMEGTAAPLGWSELEDHTRKRLDAKAARILSDAAAIRERMGEGWRPIETAWLDGSPFLARYQWLGLHRYMVIRRSEKGPWWIRDGDTQTVGNDRHAYRFTHWQPLPEPPK